MATPPNYVQVPDLNPYTPGAVSGHEAWRMSQKTTAPVSPRPSPYGYSNPSNAGWSAAGNPPPAAVTTPPAQGGSNQFNDNKPVGPSSMTSAINAYESAGAAPIVRNAAEGPGGVSISGTNMDAGANDTWRNRLYAERAAANNRGSYVGGGQPASQGQPGSGGAMEAMKVPEMPEYNAPEYAPPEEDKGVYKKERRMAMGPGMRELREGTREAISSAQSLDNPNARGKFIQQALKGYGQGLEGVAAGAHKQATAEAGRQRTEQLNTYRTQHAIKSDTYLKNYQNEINTIAANFASEQAAQVANFNAGMNPQGGATEGTSMYERFYGRPSGSTLYNQVFRG